MEHPTIKNPSLTLKKSLIGKKILRWGENAIRNYLLEKPALLEYVFQEIMLCFAEVQLYKEGVGARPDILLCQESHRFIPRHYLMIELKLPNISISGKSGKRSISSSLSKALLQQSTRTLYGLNNSEFFKKIEDKGVKGVWVDGLIYIGSQIYNGEKEAIPIKYFEEDNVFDNNYNKLKFQKSDIILGFKKMLSPVIYRSYDDLRRPIMRDIIANGPNEFDHWIETKSDWIKSRTIDFTNKEIKEWKKYNPYIS